MAKRSKAVLEEEDYTTKLSSIVERDYFPALPSLRRDLAILQARSEGDISKAVAIRRASRLLETHQSHTALKEVSIDQFHANVTSEDNATFEEVQRERLIAQRETFALTYGSRSASPESKHDNSSSIMGLLASDDFDSRSGKMAIRKERPRNSLFFTPQLPPSCSNEDKGTLANIIKAASEGLTDKNTAKTIAGSHRQMGMTGTSQKDDESSLLMSPPPPVDMSRRRDKFIQPEQTRFPKENQSRLVVASFPQHSSSSTASASDTDTDLDATPLSLNQVRKNEAIMKARECEEFVAMTPLIRPGDVLEDGKGSPIVTWGDIAATPLVVSEKVESHGMENQPLGEKLPAFTIREASYRERAAGNAEAYLAKRAREIDSGKFSRTETDMADSQQNLVKRTPLFPAAKSSYSKQSSKRPPSTISERSASLTPAARSLLSKAFEGKHSSMSKSILGKMTARDARSLGSALSRSSSTSQKRRKGLNRDKLNASLMKATPRVDEIQMRGRINDVRKSIKSGKAPEKNVMSNLAVSVKSSKNSVTKKNLTDGLLQF